MTELDQRQPFSHVKALSIAGVAVLLAVLAALPLLRLIERPFLRHLLALPFPEKNQGMFLQQKAFEYEDVLPIYGSSELTTEMEKRADQFFWGKPTGFQVCPIGAGGNHTLLSAQKIAAQGDNVRGKKVVIILSPTWFFGKPMHRDHVAGNFSPLQAIHLLRTPALNEELRRRFVTRMLDYPTALSGHELITSYLQNIESGGWKAEWGNRLLSPVLALDGFFLSLEDHLDILGATFDYDVTDMGRWKHKPASVKWSRIIRRLERQEDQEMEDAYRKAALAKDGFRDEAFIAAMSSVKEWDDFALLLDTLKHLGARALVLSVPLPGVNHNAMGLSRAARDRYYHRIEDMSLERGFAVNTFSDHDLDPEFTVKGSTHLTTKGWMYVNRLLNDFYHDRLPAAGRAVN
jgi:D-alanine transfer protein